MNRIIWPTGACLLVILLGTSCNQTDSTKNAGSRSSGSGNGNGNGCTGSTKSGSPTVTATLVDVQNVHAVALTQDGSLLAYAGDGPIKLWDMATHTIKATLPGHSKTVRCLSFSPNGSLLVSGSMDATVKIWDVAMAKELASLKQAGSEIRSAAFLADGATVVTADSGSLVVFWDVNEKAKRNSIECTASPLEAMTITPDGKLMACGFQKLFAQTPRVELWDVGTPKRKEPPINHQESVFAVALSPDAKTLAFAGDANKVFLVDTATGQQKNVLEPAPPVWIHALAFSPDGRTLASGRYGDNGAIHLWDVSSGKEIAVLKGEGAWTTSLVFSSDGRTLVAGDSFGKVQLWDVAVVTRR